MLIDASVALKLYLEEEGSPEAQLLLERTTLDAPELIIAEVANGLWKAQRRGVLSAELYAADVTNLAEIFGTLHPTPPLLARAAELARALDHPIYDCFYLACAEREEDLLVTADRRLLQVVFGTVWESLCQSLPEP